MSEKKKKKIKIDFKKKKDNTIKSLNDVENFLRNFKKISNYTRIYKLFKWKESSKSYSQLGYSPS